MSHRVKNLFSIVDSMIRMSAQRGTKEELAETLSDVCTHYRSRMRLCGAASLRTNREGSISANSFGGFCNRMITPTRLSRDPRLGWVSVPRTPSP
jgi:hypothetical protein